jgi:myosin-5
VPPFLQRKLFKQLFSFVNVQLFNQLLLRRECCSFSNGEYVKRGLAELENWIRNAGPDYTGDSWDELRFIRQAVDFLCIHQKPRKKLEEITNDLCPVLSIQQLYRISTMYWDDKYNTETVSHAVLAKMKQMMVDNSASSSHSFLLDDDSAIPFQQDDILSMIDDKHLLSELPLPASLSDTQSFTFLMQPVKLGPAGATVPPTSTP